MSKHVVATLYKLGQQNGKYTEKFKEVSRTDVVVPEKYALEVNENRLSTGLVYEINAEKTKEFEQNLKDKSERQTRLKELKDAANANLLGAALNEVVENTVKKGRPFKK